MPKTFLHPHFLELCGRSVAHITPTWRAHTLRSIFRRIDTHELHRYARAQLA
jgi:hypothetical protein